MKLYPKARRILADLAALGYDEQAQLPIETVNQFDQLHYHGTDALDIAITQIGMKPDDIVLEVGSGWGGCARYLAQTSGAHVTAVEIQEDYHTVARDLTARTGLGDKITHVNADFLALDLPDIAHDHVVSWLALYHIPDRPTYLRQIHDTLRPGGHFYAEDLFLITPPPQDEREDFEKHLFPNSISDLDRYHQDLRDAGFVSISLTDMGEDWSAFTADRLKAFRANRKAYETIHSPTRYQTIETFYDKMASYFARGITGGVRLTARRRA